MLMVAEHGLKQQSFERVSVPALELLESASAWIREGFPVWLRPLYYRDGKLTKGGFSNCAQCARDCAGGHCGCPARLCHGLHSATLNLQHFAEMLSRALERMAVTSTSALTLTA